MKIHLFFLTVILPIFSVSCADLNPGSHEREIIDPMRPNRVYQDEAHRERAREAERHRRYQIEHLGYSDWSDPATLKNAKGEYQEKILKVDSNDPNAPDRFWFPFLKGGQ